MQYGNFQGLSSRTGSDKAPQNKAFIVAKNLEYDGFQCGFYSMLSNFFDKKSATHTGAESNSVVVFDDKELGKELYKKIIIEFKST